MSATVKQLFREVDAVRVILGELVSGHDVDPSETEGLVSVNHEQFTAIWQATELLGRMGYYIAQQYNYEKAREILLIPEAEETE